MLCLCVHVLFVYSSCVCSLFVHLLFMHSLIVLLFAHRSFTHFLFTHCTFIWHQWLWKTLEVPLAVSRGSDSPPEWIQRPKLPQNMFPEGGGKFTLLSHPPFCGWGLKPLQSELTLILHIYKVFKHILIQWMVLLTSQDHGDHGGGLSWLNSSDQKNESLSLNPD